MIVKIITILAIIVFGVKPDGKYVVLLQNNNELRATGGFMGSYAVFQFKKGELKELKISDIYSPDGQLPGHVEPPPPIQKAFQNGEWRLRDSNWDPDFTVAAPKIVWFFEQGGEENIDGVAAVNFDLAKDVLEILGKIKTPDYPETVSASNLYELAQKYAELDFFPGSTQKRDFLGSVGRTIFRQVKDTSLVNKAKLLNLIFTNLRQKQILLWVKDTKVEEKIKKWKFDGGLNYKGGNYFYLVESNLGANKANCCVSRNVVQAINEAWEKVSIDFRNNSLFKDPVPPVFWGGNYINYLRVIIPANSELKSVSVNNTMLESYDEEIRGELKIIGFWVRVPFQTTVRVVLEYQRPKNKFLLIKRQPGISELPYKLVVNGQIVVNENLKMDKVFVLP